MNEAFWEKVFPVITLILGGFIQFGFSLINDKISEKKEKKLLRREKLEPVYQNLRKYVRALPELSPREILLQIDNPYDYIGCKFGDVHKILTDRITELSNNRETNKDEINRLEKLMEALILIEDKIDEAVELYNYFVDNYIDAFYEFSSAEVQLEFTKLNLMVTNAFDKRCTGFVCVTKVIPEDHNVEGINEFLKIKIKLLNEIQKDLGSI